MTALQEGVHRVNDEAGGLLTVQVIQQHDIPAMIVDALCGNAEAAQLLRLTNQAIANIHGAPRRKPMLCGCCPRALRGGRYAIIIARPAQRLGTAVHPVHGHDDATVARPGAQAFRNRGRSPQERCKMMSVPFEIVGLTSASGLLTKRISLGDDGLLVSDGSACVMGQGAARRVRLPGITAFADLIGGLKSSEAIALGSLHHDLPDQVRITTARKLAEMNGGAPRDLIARTAGHIGYLPKQPAMALLDFDTKGMPDAVAKRVNDLGGFWSAVESVAPDLEHAAKVVRRSTSSGIVRGDTGEALKGSDGLHAFVLVQDGADIERFLRTLHDRCWLAGLGWMMVGAGGQLLERSIVDRMVYSGERLVFEGAPLLMEPLAQDAKLRAPAVSNGEPANTSTACRALSMVDKATLAERKGAERHRLGKDVAQVRTKFVKDHSARIAARFGGSPAQAE